jgi:hypothetical protein
MEVESLDEDYEPLNKKKKATSINYFDSIRADFNRYFKEKQQFNHFEIIENESEENPAMTIILR